MRSKVFAFAGAAALALVLAGCGKKDEDFDPAPVAQLNAPWQMINRQATCEKSYAMFGANGFYRVSEKGTEKKYFSIGQFAVGAGKVKITTTGLGREPAQELHLMLSIADTQIRVIDITDDKGRSWKEPPKDVSPQEAAYMKNVYRITEQRFALDKCVGA